jgi:hypothetical protein
MSSASRIIGFFRCEAAPVIAYLEAERVGGVVQNDLNALRCRMTHRVANRFAPNTEGGVVLVPR